MTNNNYVVRNTSQNYRVFKQKSPLLPHLDIELTERCNSKCMHCYINLPANDNRALSQELTTDQWKNILHQAADLGTLSVRFTGGEPLLRDDFPEIYLFTRSLGIKVVLFTNARLITEEIADLFVRVPPLKNIEVSVYGMKAKSYDAITHSPGAYNEFRRGLDLLMKNDIPFLVKSVLLPPNRNEMAELEKWAETIPGMPTPSYSVNYDLRARRDLPEKNKRIKKMRFTPDETLRLETMVEDVYRQNMAKFSAKFLNPQGDRLFRCGAGLNGCVDAYGKYQMCLLLRHPETVYDLSTGSLEDGLTRVFPLLRNKKATNPEYLNRCAKCFLKGLCLQCPARSWMEYGTLDTPVEYLCDVAHHQAAYLGLIEPGEKAWEIANWRERINTFIEKESTHIKTQTQEPNSILNFNE